MDVEEALRKAVDRGEDITLATIVAVEGSAYRHEGARMAVFSDGSFIGTLSGGCLEADAAELGRQVLSDGVPRALHYDLDDDTVFGLGLGCPGKVDILLERVSLKEGPETALARFVRSIATGAPACLARGFVLEEKGAVRELTHLWVGAERTGEAPRDLSEELLAAACGEILAETAPRSRWLEVDGRPVFIDVFTPAMEIVVFGAGDDARPVAAIARSLGFAVTVVDVRGELLTAERFPDARLVHARDREAFGQKLDIGPRTMVLAMNHQIERDKEALAFALPSPAAYVGLLGPRERGERTLSALREMGALSEGGAMARFHNPVGLDIGAQTPEEIALSVLAEMVAWREGRKGGSLRQRREGIHDPRPHPDVRRVSHDR